MYPRIVPHRGHDGRVDRYLVFPCGTCPDCIKRKQNDYIQRMCLAAKEYSTLWFFTFTFSNKTIPLACKTLEADEQLDLSTEELYALKSKKNGISEEVSDDIRINWVQNCPVVTRKGKPVQLNRPYFFQENNVRYAVTATLSNRCVQLVFKQFREKVRRELGHKLEWKYVVCGEYGSFGSRPHYHGAVFGLSQKQSNLLNRLWTQRYGICTSELIPVVSKDGRDHQEFIARYVAKYMVKGSFEESLVKQGYVQRPRIILSSNLNCFSPEFIDWFTGADFISSQDLPISSYTDEQLDRLLDRHKLTVGSHQYNLGRSIKSKLFSKKERKVQLNDEVTLQCTPTNLSKALSLRVQSRALDRSIEEFESTVGASLEDASLEDCQSFTADQILSKLSAAQKALSDQKLIYQKSNF